MSYKRLWLLGLLMGMVACGGGEEEPAAEVLSDLSPRPTVEVLPTAEATAVAPDIPTAVPTSEPSPSPTVVAAVTETPTAEPEVIVFNGRTEEGALFRGAADAPVTLIDYSDFL